MDGACSSISNGVILLLFSRSFLYSGQMSPNLWLALYSPNRKSHRKRVVTLIKSTFCPLIDHALCFMSRISAYLQVAKKKNVPLHFILQLLESLHFMFDLYWFDCCIHGKLESKTFSFLFPYGYSS